MMVKHAALAALVLAAAPTASAQEPILVPDVSTNRIDIQYSFTGEQLLLFGAIIYPGGQKPDVNADIVVVVRGPSEAITLREKQKVAGVWINADAARFRTAPSFYYLASSRPVGKLVDERTAAIYELGLGNLQLSPIDIGDGGRLQRFEQGLIQRGKSHELFGEDGAAVAIRDGVLYRASIPIPARVPVGRYSAETFLISKGRVLAVASRDIEIRKSGFERFVAMAAARHGFLYGLAAIAVSLLAGYLAGQYFQRKS